MQYHYVVMYDDETGKFEMDYHTQEAKFNNAPLFDTNTDKWLQLEAHHWETDDTIYNRAADTLYLAIDNLTIKED